MNHLEIGSLPELDYACNEALNTLATNLSYCGPDIRVVAVTSRFAGEGKSYISVNLLRTLSTLQKRVLLIDMDLRRSSIAARYHLHFKDEQPMGVAHYLAGMCDLQDIVYSTNLERAYFIPVGRELNSSLQLLNSPRMQELMDFARANFDLVLVDTPPAGVIVDALEIARHCDGEIIVVSYNRGSCNEVNEIKHNIERTGCKVLGVVLNNVELRSFSNRRYYYRSERYYSYYHKQYKTDQT